MEAKELRIGNIIYFGIVNEPIKIKAIDPNSTTILMAEPIPLTEDWLLKLGGKKDDCDTSKDLEIDGYYTLNGLDFRQSWETGQFYFVTRWEYDTPEEKAYFDYVHELQNFYYSIRKEELTIKQSQPVNL